jgi:hypothetical protein
VHGRHRVGDGAVAGDNDTNSACLPDNSAAPAVGPDKARSSAGQRDASFKRYKLLSSAAAVTHTFGHKIFELGADDHHPPPGWRLIPFHEDLPGFRVQQSALVSINDMPKLSPGKALKMIDRN